MLRLEKLGRLRSINSSQIASSSRVPQRIASDSSGPGTRPVFSSHNLCSGVFVSPTVLVTAAHCFPDGATVQATAVSIYSGRVELLASDPVAAEERMRPAYDTFRKLGERATCSTLAAILGGGKVVEA